MRANRLVLATAAIFLLLSACHRQTKVSLPPVPALPPPSVTTIEQANRAFISGNYTQAAQAYEHYLQLEPSGGQRDLALFRLGLTYALRPAPNQDWQRAATMLRQVIEDYPASPLKVAAMIILALRTELEQTAANTKQRDDRIRQLTTELERLKKIDAERKRATGR
jgi:hypothetical protein